MDRVEFLSHRVAFSGLPYGELVNVLSSLASAPREVSRAGLWGQGFLAFARGSRRHARRAAGEGRWATSAGAWLDAARAYHVASFRLHLEEHPEDHLESVRRLRLVSRACYGHYLEAVARDEASTTRILPLSVPPGSGPGVGAYLHLPAARPTGVVVLLNGLDSLCEVEMHAFARWLVARGIAALAVDLPCDVGGGRMPSDPEPWRLEEWASGIAEALAGSPATTRLPAVAFGVSFGGHLAARALAGDPRFVAAVAVSPGAFLGPEQWAVPRVRAMARLAFGLAREEELDALGRRLDIRRLEPTRRPLLLLAMDRDLLFGPEHVAAIGEFCPGVEIRRFDAEHVGTSLLHRWMPETLDWIEERFVARSSAVDLRGSQREDAHARAV